MSGIFIDVANLPHDAGGFCQIMFLFTVYGYVLMYASNLISDGSELLLLVPSIAGIVGSVILPVLGAVPDGAIVLFSGMGPNAQEQLNVGVGALAGSTIMLLTVPWLLSVVGGRVSVVNGKANYSSPKLPSPEYISLFGTGVAVSKAINQGAVFMLLSAIPYLIIQLPGLYYINAPVEEQSAGDQVWAKTTLLFCISFLSYYLYKQYAGIGIDDSKIGSSMGSVINALNEEVIVKAISDGTVSLLGVMYDELVSADTTKAQTISLSSSCSSSNKGYQSISSSNAEEEEGGHKGASFQISAKPLHKLHRILRPFFHRYDRDNDGTLDMTELSAVFSDLGEDVSAKALRDIFSVMDADKSGDLDFNEFVNGVVSYCLNHRQIFAERMVFRETGFDSDSMNGDVVKDSSQLPSSSAPLKVIIDNEDDSEEEEEEEEEIPEDLAHLLPDEQQRRIKLRSLWLMGLGTALVLLFSDPMVDVMSEIGNRTGISSFYISFLLAPLASNASEVIASYNYAQKKTTASITIALSTLQGAAVMNNSFVLGIFMLLIVMKGLAWQFFAETASILFVQLAMTIISLRKTHTIFDALCVIALYPASLLLVAYLESIGWN